MNSWSSRPTAGKGLDLEMFLLRFIDLTLYQEVPKLFSEQELRGRVDKTPAQKYQDRQFASSGFLDSRSNHHQRHLGDTSKTTKVTGGKKNFWKSLALYKLSPNKKYFHASRVPLSRPQKLLAWHEFPAGKFFLTTPRDFSAGSGLGRK